VRAILRDAARNHGASLVDFFRERREDKFSDDPQRFYARDQLHPSSEGYRAAHEEIERASPIAGALAEHTAAVMASAVARSRW